MIKQAQIKKEYLLLVAGVVLIVFCYQLAFKKTVDAWHLHRQLESQLTQSAGVSTQPDYSERKSGNISRLLNLYKADTVNFRSNIISRISTIAEKENVKLSEVPTENAEFRHNQINIQKLSFEGDYFSLLRTLNNLQKAPDIGLLRSIGLKSIENHSSESASRKLVLTIYLVTHS